MPWLGKGRCRFFHSIDPGVASRATGLRSTFGKTQGVAPIDLEDQSEENFFASSENINNPNQSNNQCIFNTRIGSQGCSFQDLLIGFTNGTLTTESFDCLGRIEQAPDVQERTSCSGEEDYSGGLLQTNSSLEPGREELDCDEVNSTILGSLAVPSDDDFEEIDLQYLYSTGKMVKQSETETMGGKGNENGMTPHELSTKQIVGWKKKEKSSKWG